ncbi:MAG TPA: YceI family protein [Candidatus Solibacter sp.]|nr:YceI family protein [Candidatus Solibacter sp.]
MKRANAFTAWTAILIWNLAAHGQPHAIDTERSTVTVRVYKAGVLSAFGHDHAIAAPIASGSVDVSARQVELRVNANLLRVGDAKVSDKDRAEIQSTMHGAEVLDAARYPEIVFRSTDAEPAGDGAWRLHGSLTLHGETRPVVVEVRERDGRYVGASRFRQTEFSIKPVKVAGGAVRVKDEIRVEFDIGLLR